MADKINNKDLFDDQELPKGHFERFEALLDKEEDKTKKLTKRSFFITIMSIAASLVILILGGYHILSSNDYTITEGDKNIPSSEFSAMNDFYRQQMNQQIADIMCKLENADSETQAELGGDIQYLISENNDFIEDISENNNSEVAIRYMVKHYKTNIQALKFINEKLGNYINC